MRELARCLWPAERLCDLLDLLRRKGSTPLAGLEPPREVLSDLALLGPWLERAASHAGLALEEVAPQHGEVERLVHRAPPAIVSLSRGGRARFLLLIGSRKRTVSLIGPDGEEAVVDRKALCRAMKAENEAAHRPAIEALIGAANLSPKRHELAVEAILDARISERTGPVWLVSSSEGRSSAGVRSLAALVAGMILTRTAISLAMIGLFAVIGSRFFAAELGSGWLIACALLVATRVPLHLLEIWLSGWFAMRAGVMLKRWLLAGALGLRPEEVKSDGAGVHFARANEADSMEAAAGGGLLGLLSIVDLIIGAVVLCAGGGTIGALALAGWFLLTALGAGVFLLRHRRWSRARIDIAGKLLERMIGHRTRLAQAPPELHHDEEEQELIEYVETSRSMDASAVISGIMPAGWIIIGLFTLIGPLVVGGISGASLAISIGGVLLTSRAFEGFSASVRQLAGAISAFWEVRPLWQAAARVAPLGHPRISLAPLAESTGPLMELSNVDVDAGAQPVLRGVNLSLRRGERLLLEGASGSGKSSLARVITGLDRPKHGLVVLGGLDLETTGRDRWRAAIASAPQLHDNHIFSATLAFNLLLGRRWPATPRDLEEARAVCRSLGLDEMLERMPSGLDQMIGDAGWRLSHGERSRVFIARTLLSGADLVVLDESLAALDPETLQEVMLSVLHRTKSLLLIAHP